MALYSRHLMPDGFSYVLNLVKKNRLVVSTEVEEQDSFYAIMNIERKGLYPNLKVYFADVYILTAADFDEIMDYNPDVNCIVVISNWNQYTVMAKQEARQNNIGLFTLEEFRKALNFRGEKFLDTGVDTDTE